MSYNVNPKCMCLKKFRLKFSLTFLVRLFMLQISSVFFKDLVYIIDSYRSSGFNISSISVVFSSNIKYITPFSLCVFYCIYFFTCLLHYKIFYAQKGSFFIFPFALIFFSLSDRKFDNGSIFS